jgi:hypothetical protein
MDKIFNTMLDYILEKIYTYWLTYFQTYLDAKLVH